MNGNVLLKSGTLTDEKALTFSENTGYHLIVNNIKFYLSLTI